MLGSSWWIQARRGKGLKKIQYRKRSRSCGKVMPLLYTKTRVEGTPSRGAEGRQRRHAVEARKTLRCRCRAREGEDRQDHRRARWLRKVELAGQVAEDLHVLAYGRALIGATVRGGIDALAV